MNRTVNETGADIKRETECENPGRRRALRLIAGMGLVTAAAVSGILKKRRLAESPDIEKSEWHPIPEDERTGKNILLMLPTNGDSECYSSDSDEMHWIECFMERLPKDTTVILLVPLDVERSCLERLAQKYKNVTVVALALDISPSCVLNHMAYPQDIFFPTGTVDGQGKFNLFTSSLDAMFTELRFSSTVKKQRAKGRATPEIDMCEALRFLGDELCIEKHAAHFAKIPVPISCMGGDLQIIKLPNGKTGCLLGKTNLANMSLALAYAKGTPAKNIVLSKSDLELIKEIYKRTLKVDECIILDEEAMIGNAGAATYETMVYGSAFFHSDMIVKTASSPKNHDQQLAFVTDVPSLEGIGINTNTYIQDIPYLIRIREQFESLGYKVVRIPCGPWPTMNYTNSVMFTRDDKKYVVVPQYGIGKDQEAVEAFENEGFEVIKVDMSFINGIGKAKEKTGSLHCRTVVLN